MRVREGNGATTPTPSLTRTITRTITLTPTPSPTPHQARAEELYRECLQIREHVWGGPHPETIKTAEQLLRLYRASDRKEDMRALQARRTLAARATAQHSPPLASPHLASPPLASPRLASPHLTVRALQRSIGAWRREGSIDASATWLRAWVPFPLREVACT